MGISPTQETQITRLTMIKATFLVFLVGGAVMANKDHDNLCRELIDYGDLTYTNEVVNVCTSTLEKTCEEHTEEECMDVTELECEVELFTDCSMSMTTVDVTNSEPTTLTKTLPTCTKEYRTEEHEKIHYECKEVTKKQCTTLWEIINGEKVWAGIDDDDCKEVTWEECTEEPVTVEWEVPFMNCIDDEYDYLSYQDTTTTLMVNTMECPVKTRVVCEPKLKSKCASITFTTCTEEPVEECHEKEVPCPSKEKIHKQWCLFNQGETAGPVNPVVDVGLPGDDFEDEVFQ